MKHGKKKEIGKERKRKRKKKKEMRKYEKRRIKLKKIRKLTYMRRIRKNKKEREKKTRKKKKEREKKTYVHVLCCNSRPSSVPTQDVSVWGPPRMGPTCRRSSLEREGDAEAQRYVEVLLSSSV